MNKKIVDISTLGQDNIYHITKMDDVIYKVSSSSTIYVEKGIHADILDMISNGEIKYYVNDRSSLKVNIIDSANTNRYFSVDGEININEISINDTLENLVVDLINNNSMMDAKILSVLSNGKSKFIQRVNHNKNETISDISNFGVAIKNSDIMFDTTGFIKHRMNKSNCRQLSKGIVMDNSSSITSKPILLIDEYDCFASHGAAIGKMSDESLFYLMSRGLSKDDAFLLILNGIIKPFIDNIDDDVLKEKLENDIDNLIKK